MGDKPRAACKHLQRSHWRIWEAAHVHAAALNMSPLSITLTALFLQGRLLQLLLPSPLPQRLSQRLLQRLRTLLPTATLTRRLERTARCAC